MSEASDDWDPEAYGRFRGLRLRPALDLLAQVTGLPDGDVVDLGCGSGAAAAALARRFPDRARLGVDLSPAMLAAAAGTGFYTAVQAADASVWQPARPAALIFSNAALQWLGNHDRLLPRLAGLLLPGGILAVQMPRQFGAPSHRLLRDIAAGLFPDRFGLDGYVAPVRTAEGYWRMLVPLGEVTAWETEYVQRLEPSGHGHPVRRFTESTAMRPFLDRLTAEETRTLLAAYDEALGAAYPLEPDGSALMPFLRVFLTLRV